MKKIILCAPTDEVAFYLDDAIKAMKKERIPYAEIRDVDGINVLEFSDAQAKKNYNKLKKANIKVWSMSSPVGKRDFLIPFKDFQARAKRIVEIAKIFHCKNIRVFSFFNHNNNVKEVVKRISYVVKKAKKENLLVCLENEKDSYGDIPEHIVELLDKIPGLLSVYDSSNFVQVGVKSSRALKVLFPRAYYVHFKDGIHKNNDAEITPVGEGEADIKKLISLVDREMVFSIEHHLRFPVNKETYKQIKNSQKFVYRNTTEAFYDASKHAHQMLLKGGYKETKPGVFVKK